MRFATIRDFRINVSSILQRAGDETVVVTLRGKPVALFVPVDEERLEEMARAISFARLRASVDKLQEEARKSGASRLSPSAIEREINRARRQRRG